ncbi:MAG: hypothetical protein HFF99_08375 [Oscillibacter sp.]|nr:hypothetical protein [uncultured Oscillibacter sp.]MCI8971467.1 hypothetical protein [Oscillibacter sp.]
MRMYGYLKTPRLMNRGDRVCKVMLHETRQEGTCAYLYDRPDALFSFSDLHCPTLEDAREDWDGRLDPRGWISMEDPLPGCQHDCPLSVRITGRDRGAPQWGQHERLQDGEWKDFTP